MKRGSGHAKRHYKSIKNRYKIDAGKRHGQIMENDAKMEPKWEPKSIKNRKNAGKKVCQKNMNFEKVPPNSPSSLITYKSTR